MASSSRHKEILSLALPAIVANITVPLLGLVDTAIVGHMGSATYIGAIAVGSMIFSLVYWLFGFLRMGTSGLTAQAFGRRDAEACRALFRRSLRLALLVSLGVLVLRWPLRELMLLLISPTDDVRPLATTYFNIVVWGSPAVLGLYALTGWYIGVQNTRMPMLVSILQNVVNIFLSLFFVYGLGMKVEGVALGTVIAQYVGFVVALVPPARNLRNIWQFRSLQHSPESLFSLNRDIFLRTFCLVAVNLYFTSVGAQQGATILAVNTLLLQLYLLFSYVMDGFAYAGEALGGRYWGARDVPSFRDVVRKLFLWGVAMTLLFTTVYVVGGMPFLHLLTDTPSVVEASRGYVWWAYLIPVAGVAAFIWDGIFIGTTHSRGMLLSAALAAFVFFAGTFFLTGEMGNHGLWLSMIAYLALRGLVQTFLYFRFVPL